MLRELWIILCHLFGFLLLMEGLFPYSSSSLTNQMTNQSCFDNQKLPDRHVILMLIDALRSDYVLNRNSSYRLKSIEYFEEQNCSFSVELQTHSPTVTLPRLKSILTGTIPSFWDVIFNYNSTRLEVDNILFQYKRQYPQRKIVFYGDDTWLKLFPEKIFDRFEGVESFFVNDYDEIDVNVTNRLYFELNQMNQWNLLIVHYLGVDHIGHSHGALNSLIHKKLAQLDEIIATVFHSLNFNDILIITGDHGMIDQGGHGGTSEQETHVPLTFLSHQLQFLPNSFLENKEKYYQIDLTATLSSLLEIGIPWNNLGIAIETVLKRFYSREKSHFYHCFINENRRQLLRLLSDLKCSMSEKNVQSIRDQAISLSNQQDFIIILISCFLFLSSTILGWTPLDSFTLRIPFGAIVLLLFFSLIIDKMRLSLALSMIIFNISLLTIQRKQQTSWIFLRKRTLSARFLDIYPLIHLVSLFSSSFIEEEHQCWFYFLSTYFFLLSFENNSLKELFILVCLRLLRSWNQTGNKWLNSPDIADFLNQDQHQIYLFILNLIVLSLFSLSFYQSKRSSMSLILPICLFIYRSNLLNNSLTSTIPRFYYICLVFLLLIRHLSLKTFLFSLLFMISRSHQIFVLGVHFLLQRFIHIDNAHLAFLLSQAAFFHLGNSNSFVTIDISTGFVGLSTYSPLVHGIFIYFSLYGLSIQWLTNLANEQRKSCWKQLALINSFFVLCVTIQRSHLFLWTVFTPKLFYLFAQTCWNLLLFLPPLPFSCRL